mmetsp:Transcript_43631/g.103710  ORF Transcript_43631/g.103710 Transcript_43631/m.103710 type:complete len:253 (-) Transcript_43631:121-879(-)
MLNLPATSTIPHDGSTRYLSRAVVRILKACFEAVLLISTSAVSAITRDDPTILSETTDSFRRKSTGVATSHREACIRYPTVTMWSDIRTLSRASHHCDAFSPRTSASVVSSGAGQSRTRNLSVTLDPSSARDSKRSSFRGSIVTRTSTKSNASMIPLFGVVEKRSRAVVLILNARRSSEVLRSVSSLSTDCRAAGWIKSIDRCRGSTSMVILLPAGVAVRRPCPDTPGIHAADHAAPRRMLPAGKRGPPSSL